MNIFEFLNTLDTNVFLAINGLHNSFFDVFMWLTSEKFVWFPLYAALIFIFIKNYGKNAVWIIIALILSIVVADQIASGILKNTVERFRPSHEWSIDGLVHLINGDRSGLYGFASSHAANSFAIAVFSALVFRNKIFTLAAIIWATTISYSRIYVGVHYPLDILGGMIIGICSAMFFYVLIKKYFPLTREIFSNQQDTRGLTVYYIVYFATWLCFVLYSFMLVY